MWAPKGRSYIASELVRSARAFLPKIEESLFLLHRHSFVLFNTKLTLTLGLVPAWAVECRLGFFSSSSIYGLFGCCFSAGLAHMSAGLRYLCAGSFKDKKQRGINPPPLKNTTEGSRPSALKHKVLGL